MERPRLLFNASELPRIRRTLPDGGRVLLDGVRRVVKTFPGRINQVLASWSSAEAVQVAEAYALTGEEEFAEWTRRRLRALVQEKSWKFSLHEASCPNCDHVMANVGAGVAYAHDLLGESVGEALTALLETEMPRLLFDPFLKECRNENSFWSHPKARSNWAIMTGGDAGFAIVALGRKWEHQQEGIEAAIRLVEQTLDHVGKEGDWFEGTCYWFATLAMGLRFIIALERATEGAQDLTMHPVLQRTGRFAALSATSSGRLYAYGDNWTDPNHIRAMQASLGMLMAALLSKRPDWLHFARQFQTGSLLWTALDDGAIAGRLPEELIARFDEPGIATIRSGWKPKDAFVGLRCGGTTTAHDHLDAASFHFEASGVPLIIDPGCWWYGDGAHEMARKPNYDGSATVGHTTLLVDGRGQEPANANRILSVSKGPGWSRIVADASGAYGSRLERFIRTIVLLGNNALVIRDVVKATEPRHFEWLLQHEAEVFDEGPHSIFVREGVRMCVTPLAPTPHMGYRITDSVRRTLYVAYDTDESQDVKLKSRGFGPIDRSVDIEFLMLVWVGPESAETAWDFESLPDGAVVHSPHHGIVVLREGDELRIEAACL